MLNLSVVRVIATGVVFAAFIGAAVISLGDIDNPTYWFPAFIAVSGALVSAFSFGLDLRKVLAGESVVDGDVTDLGANVNDSEPQEGVSIRRRVLAWSLWLIALPLLALVIPFFYASLIWVTAVLRFAAHRRWLFIAISVIAFGVVVNVLIVLLQIDMPPALITGWG